MDLTEQANMPYTYLERISACSVFCSRDRSATDTGIRHKQPSLNRSPAILRLIFGRSLARLPCPQVLQRHSGVAKGTSIDPLARGPSTEPLLGQGHVARLSGTGVKPVSCRCLGRTSARHPLREASRWHPGVAKWTSIDPLARGPSTEPLLGQGHVARLSGTGVKPVSCRYFGRTSARHPRREASRWHPGVAR